MKIELKERLEYFETKIKIYCKERSKKINKIIMAIQSVDESLQVYSHKETYVIKKQDILYIEVVDRRVFVYTKSQEYELKKSLQQVENELQAYGFFRVSKTTLVNIYHIRQIKPYGNQKFIASVADTDKVEISRKYAKQIIEMIG